MICIDSTQCPLVRFSRMLPLSYTRQHIIVITPLTQLMKTHVIALLAWPTFINSSARHNLSGWPFSSKNQRRLLPCFLYKSFFCGCDNTPIWHIHYCIYTIYINEERCKLFSWQSPFHNMTGQKYWRHTKVSVRNFAKLLQNFGKTNSFCP